MLCVSRVSLSGPEALQYSCHLKTAYIAAKICFIQTVNINIAHLPFHAFHFSLLLIHPASKQGAKKNNQQEACCNAMKRSDVHIFFLGGILIRKIKHR